MDRAMAPVVGKTLEAGIVVLFLALLTTTLYGNVVPGYRTAAADELGERALATTAQRVQQAVPPLATHASARHRVSLPATIRGAAYRIRVTDRALVLDHPNDAIDARARLALPPTVVSVTGEWASGGPLVVRVARVEAGFAVTLEGT